MAKKMMHEGVDGLSAKGTLSWKLEKDCLVIGGSGRMRNFTDTEPAPWQPLADQIRSVSVGDGMENIGGRAFQGFQELQDVRLGSAVSRIGWRAFYGCSRLEAVTGQRPLRHWRLPEVPDVTLVGHQAFRGTQIPQEELVIHEGVVLEYTGTNPEVVIPKGIREIAPYAFAGTKLESVKFPWTLERVGHSAFYATGLKEITLPARIQQLDAFAFAGNPELNRVFLGKASVKCHPSSFEGTPACAGKRIGRWLLSQEVMSLRFLELEKRKWSVSELLDVVKNGGVVLRTEHLWDGNISVESCCLSFRGNPVSYWQIPYLAEEGPLGEQAVESPDVEHFRRRYAEADTWLSIWKESDEHWDDVLLKVKMEAWQARALYWGETLFVSWDRDNFQGPLELALCKKWLDEHTDAFVGCLTPEKKCTGSPMEAGSSS